MIERELADLSETLTQMKTRWTAEKEAIARIRATKERIEQRRREAERAEKESALERAAQLRYGEIPELEREIESLNAGLAELQKDGALLAEEVRRTSRPSSRSGRASPSRRSWRAKRRVSWDSRTSSACGSSGRIPRCRRSRPRCVARAPA